MKRYACDDAVKALLNQGLGCSEISKQLNLSRFTVYDIIKRLQAGGGFIAKKETITELRKQGDTYQEIADKLGFTHDQIEQFCKRNGLGYSEEEKQKAQTKRGKELAESNKGKTFVNWDKRVLEVLGGRFELVSWILTDNGESRLKVKCTTCGAEKEISSISLRSRQSNRIVSCGICSHLEAEQRHKQEQEKREFEKNEKQRLREVRKLKKAKQISFTFCECGKIIPNGTKYCDDCREKHKRKSQRQIERRKEHKRRTRIGKTFDRGITLEKLYDRDQGICYLCNRTCDWGDFQKINGAFVVGGSYPTVEHLIPLCKGGTHTWNNIKLACHSCNSKKGRRSYESIAPL